MLSGKKYTPINDATLWNSGKTARHACYSIPFIGIQSIFLIHGKILEYIYQFYFFPAIMMHMVSENQSWFSRFPENHWVV